MTRSATFVLINRSCVEFRGFNVRERYIELTGRPPVYNSRTRSFVTTPGRLKDFLALLETRSYDIVIQAHRPDPDQTEAIAPTSPSSPEGDLVELDAELW